MNKILATIWLFAAAMCFTACESEDPLQPSNADTNPFITDDNADDEESLLRKEFYSKNIFLVTKLKIITNNVAITLDIK